MKKVKLSPPWVVYYHEIDALFKNDEDIELNFDETTTTINIKVKGSAKADALEQLLPHEVTFGSVILYIKVTPSNTKLSRAALIRDAFTGNKAFSYMETFPDVMSNPITFAVFKKEVVQYFTDDLSDIYGIRSTLYQDIAKEIIGEDEGVYFCTDVNDFDEIGIV